MLNYIGFGFSAFMMMVSLTVGSFGWAAGWLLLVWFNALSVAEDVQMQEMIAKIPAELKAEVYKAITATKAVRP